jgi:predicted  nucleic acid-binding Zn-ribbon protein
VHKGTESALDTMERGLVQMRDYQAARRKLESRRLAYDSVLSKVQKMKKEDVRTEEELRSARAKYEETSEDVHNRMMAIQEAEVHPFLSPYLYIQMTYHYRAINWLI